MKIIKLAALPEEVVSHNPAIKKKVMLRNSEVPHLSGFSQARFAPGQVAGGHAHDDMYEVFFVVRGEGMIRIDDTEHQLVAGICIVVEPGEMHEIRNVTESEFVLSYFGVKS